MPKKIKHPRPKPLQPAELRHWVVDHSIPREEIPEPPIDRGKKKPLDYFKKRVKTLSQPLKRYTKKPPNLEKYLMVKKKALKYKITPRMQNLAEPLHPYISPSEMSFQPESRFLVSKKALKGKIPKRVKKLAIPRVRRDNNTKRGAFKVSKLAMSYEASPKIIELSKPRPNLAKKPWRVPRPISKKAKNYTASAHITDLAKPIDRKDTVTRKNAFRVRKKALTATASERVIELAKPRQVTKKFKARR